MHFTVTGLPDFTDTRGGNPLATMDFTDRVVMVTGAGQGLGRSHALALGRRGAKVLVNDFGGTRAGVGSSVKPAEETAAMIRDAGGEAMAHLADVSDFVQVQEMVQRVMNAWGRVDVLVNNAGILRDKTFSKMALENFEAVMNVHVGGAVNCTKAVWDVMKAQNYGRIVFTTSASGLFGNFGQTNYAAAKMALVGLMNSLRLEGRDSGIRVNCLAPLAATRMTEDLLPPQALELIAPDSVTTALVFLVSEEAPNGKVLGAGAGTYAGIRVVESPGVYCPPEKRSPEYLAEQWQAIDATQGQVGYASIGEQTAKYFTKAGKALGLDLGPLFGG